MPKKTVGAIGWVDLTVPDAAAVRDFYRDVAGWSPEPVDMGEYSDFNMTADGQPVAGVCHARGANAGLPAQWPICITVADLEESMHRCRERGGAIVHGPTDMGASGRFCVIHDPAGAVAALFAAAR